MTKRRTTILLVEDDDIQAHLVMRSLAKALLTDLCLYCTVWNEPPDGEHS